MLNAFERTAIVEVALLAGGGALLLWAGFTRQSWGTLSGLYWMIRDRLSQPQKWTLAGVLAAALGYLWWHLVYG